MQDAPFLPMFSSQQALTLSVVNRWSTMEQQGRRGSYLGAGLVESTAAFFAECAALESAHGIVEDEAILFTELPTVRDCWMAGVTIALLCVQGESCPTPPRGAILRRSR